MIRCLSCSAPLPGYTGICAYCGGNNDVDRAALAGARASQRETRYACPVCGVAMQAVDVGAGRESVTLDQCGTCFGHFFPFFGLEPLLADAAKYGALLDVKRLDDLSRHPVEYAVAYRKCPICTKFMNRINFGQRSGVITDQCHNHGIWLDAGELKRLVEWKNAGGELVNKEYREHAQREAEKRRQRELEKLARLKKSAGPDGGY